jgi:hypothetical protein
LDKYFKNIAQQFNSELFTNERTGPSSSMGGFSYNSETTYMFSLTHQNCLITVKIHLGIRNVGIISIESNKIEFEEFQFKGQTFLQKVFKSKKPLVKIISKNTVLADQLNSSYEFIELSNMFDDLSFRPYNIVKNQKSQKSEFSFRYSLFINNYPSIIIPAVNFLKKYIDFIIIQSKEQTIDLPS